MSDRRRKSHKPPSISAAHRQTIEAEIERLIAILDLVDPDPDLEETGDLEPYLAGSPSGIHCDAEGDSADDEPSLGSLDRAMDQRRWNECQCINGANDLELDRADYEDGGDRELNGDELDGPDDNGIGDGDGQWERVEAGYMEEAARSLPPVQAAIASAKISLAAHGRHASRRRHVTHDEGVEVRP